MNFFKSSFNGYKGQNKVVKIVMIGFLIALSLVIHFLTKFFTWPLASFLKLDFSLLPILVALFVYDFWVALLMILIRFGFNLAIEMDQPVFWYGPLIQLNISIAGMMFLMVSCICFIKLLKTNGMAIVISISLTTAFLVIYGTITNWLWATPLYFKLLDLYNGSINVVAFSDYYASSSDAKVLFGGIKNWFVASWSVFGVFNLVKFASIFAISLPIIKVTYSHFSGKRITFKKEKITPIEVKEYKKEMNQASKEQEK